jgi:hypothetical protein
VITTARSRITLSLAILAAVLTLSFVLFSPWHRHSAHGRQECPFFQIEQNYGLEAEGPIFPLPALLQNLHLSEERTLLPNTPVQWTCAWRAPPA